MANQIVYPAERPVIPMIASVIRPLNDAALSIQVDHEKHLVWIASDDRFYEEAYDGGALAALIAALQLAHGLLPVEETNG